VTTFHEHLEEEEDAQNLPPGYVLYDHLVKLVEPNRDKASPESIIANLIIADPQVHVDVLVQAGLLERVGSESDLKVGGRPVYQVVVPEPPHVHEWGVAHVDDERVTVTVNCPCGEWRQDIVNKLPIEVPE
jgi:hypothetical protein